MVFVSALHRFPLRMEEYDDVPHGLESLPSRMRASVMHASYTPRPLATAYRKNIDSIWNQHYKRFGADALTKQGC